MIPAEAQIWAPAARGACSPAAAALPAEAALRGSRGALPELAAHLALLPVQVAALLQAARPDVPLGRPGFAAPADSALGDSLPRDGLVALVLVAPVSLRALLG
ncbi:MAG: hypothetical protein WA294_08280, partial [Acidobacteriaceae bacterium]